MRILFALLLSLATFSNGKSATKFEFARVTGIICHSPEGVKNYLTWKQQFRNIDRKLWLWLPKCKVYKHYVVWEVLSRQKWKHGNKIMTLGTLRLLGKTSLRYGIIEKPSLKNAIHA